MTNEAHKTHDAEVERTREYWSAALTGIKAKTRAFLWKWSVVIILGVLLLLTLVWTGHIIVSTGGGGGDP